MQAHALKEHFFPLSDCFNVNLYYVYVYVCVGAAEFLPETDLLSYQGKSGNIFGGSVGASAGMASVTLEGQGSSKIQTPVGKLRKEELDIRKLMCDTDNRLESLFHN